MQKVLIMPALAVAMLAGACSKDGDPTVVDTTPKARFFSAVWNAPDGIGFTTNGTFVTGSKLAYNQSTPSCSQLNAGTTTFGIGLANPNGTSLSSAELASLSNQSITDGGNYTVLAGGNAIHPSVIMLDNRFTGTLGSNQAAVRFVNLAAAGEFPFTVMKGAGGTGSPSVVQDLTFRSATPFSTVSSGSNAYTILANQQAVISGADATLNLQAGTVNTVVISRLDPPSGNFQLINVTGCP